MSVAIVNYLQFRSRETFEPVSPLWQNFYVDRTTDFLAFAYGQGAGQVAGERSQANLVIPVNQISLNYIYEASSNRYLAEITTKEINIISFEEVGLVSQELWTIGSYSDDQEIATLVLRGPGDATKTGPGRVLSRKFVGSIPSSGTLVIS
jgi:hypothetical protein